MAYAPYFTRLDHLTFLEHMIGKRPHAAAWYERTQARPGYQKGIARWINPKYLSLMEEKGSEAWPRVEEMLTVA